MALPWDQISGITAKKFIPKLVDNIFDSRPFFERMKRKNLMKLDGGTQILQPLGYAVTDAAGWYSGADTLNTADNEQITSADYNWKFSYVNITIKRTDELKNSGDAAKISLVRSKTQMAEKTMANQLGVALWNAGTDANAMGGLRHILSTSNTVGGIDQSANSWWQANVDSTSTVLSMAALQSQFTAATIGSDGPSVAYTTRTIYDLYYSLL